MQAKPLSMLIMSCTILGTIEMQLLGPQIPFLDGMQRISFATGGEESNEQLPGHWCRRQSCSGLPCPQRLVPHLVLQPGWQQAVVYRVWSQRHPRPHFQRPCQEIGGDTSNLTQLLCIFVFFLCYCNVESAFWNDVQQNPLQFTC